MTSLAFTNPSRVLVTGATGQVGEAFLKARVPGPTVYPVSHKACDITDFESIRAIVAKVRPDVVVNLAAYTAVDRAEGDSQAAFNVNSLGAANVARASALVGARVIHVSTDYVFDGERLTPYPPNAATHPLNVYGASKLAGEDAMRMEAPNVLIIRSSWLYSTTGKNFLLRIIDLLHSGAIPKVVTDQRGSPTLAADLAEVLWLCAQRPDMKGVYHFANAGDSSWYEFACEIQALVANERGGEGMPRIIPVTSAEHNALAARPRYSVLDSSALLDVLCHAPRAWKAALRHAVNELRIFPQTT